MAGEVPMLRAEHNPAPIVAALALFSLALSLAARPARAEWVDWIADAELGFEFTDNLNRSAFGSDEEDDFSWRPHARVGRVYQLTDRTRVSLAAEVEGGLYHDFDWLNALEGGAELALLHKFGLGDAPWVRVFSRGAYQHVDQGERGGPRFEVGFMGGKRFSPRFDAALGYRFVDRDGRTGPVAVPAISTDVFDQQYHLLTLSGSFLLTESLLVTAGYTLREGDFDSACTPDNVGRVLAEEDVEAIALDKAFGGCVYRLDGTAHAGFVNLNYGLTRRFSVDLGYRFRYGKADSLSYRGNTARLTLLYRY